jgi:hypothetical protein
MTSSFINYRFIIALKHTKMCNYAQDYFKHKCHVAARLSSLPSSSTEHSLTNLQFYS